ncbi:MerR family transcriptional regulator [Paenibacillus protaetiae]|uniref:MerR family transcriptional regulator n=1 Tax=Paenibacillus protaetiae TaxID=2509456 RepID=A0A4P6EVX5_9BACL|nr:MerR family transcriptional regulator [Paenibacillus protaetiae]QAY65849.1 MerR family transcriptional regulator [Paenibacillus protaetiae]
MSRLYTISEAAQLTGVSADTLRYYEKIGLLDSPQRGAGAARMYSEPDIRSIQFLILLRNTRMPLKQMEAYVQKYAHKDHEGCYQLLDEHRIRIEQQLEELNETLRIVRYKLEHYQEIKDGKRKDY